MKDLPHHMKKLNRRIIRSEHRLEEEEADYAQSLPSLASGKKRPKAQLRKQVKTKMRQEREARTPNVPTSEEKNRKMKKRVPIFDRTSKVRSLKAGARPSKKKMPRI